MKVVVVLATCALVACGFDVNAGAGRDGGGSGSDGSASSDATIIDARVDPPVACSSPITNGLVACFELEDNVDDGTLRDSSPAHVDASTMGLVATQRTKPTTSEAASVTNSASTYVPDSPALDLATGYTVTMWVQVNSLPPTSMPYGLYDHELQYAAVVGRSGDEAYLRCINTDRNFEYTSQLPTNTWVFVACTWDGSNLCAQYWSSTTDHERYCTVPGGIVADGARGLALGHLSENGSPSRALDGSFDSVQVYNRALADGELCTMIGQGTDCLPCNGICPVPNL